MKYRNLINFKHTFNYLLGDNCMIEHFRINNTTVVHILELTIINSLRILNSKNISLKISTQDNVPDVKPSLLLRYIKRCNKEKLRSIEDSYVTKSYSGESIFLKDGIDDVNEVC